MNDYVLFFKKPGDGEPVRGLYDKKINPDGWFTQENWIKWARGSWDEIKVSKSYNANRLMINEAVQVAAMAIKFIENLYEIKSNAL